MRLYNYKDTTPLNKKLSALIAIMIIKKYASYLRGVF